MKNFKRISSVVLAIVMVFAMMVPAMAADGKITIKPDTVFVGETYSIYKIFDATLGSNNAVSYTIDKTSPWYSVVEAYAGIDLTEAAGNDAIMVVTKNDNFDVATFVETLNTNKDDIAATDSIDADTTTVEFTGLDYGYYFVDTTTGTLCSIDTTTPEVEIEDKNKEADIAKEVRDVTDNGEFGAKSHAEIGEEVEFKITVTAQPGAENYIVHDTLDAGLTLDADSIEIAGLTENDDYIIYAPSVDDTCTLDIAFTQEYLDTITDANTQIVITYKAIVNENAIADQTDKIGTSVNSVNLTYGNNQKTETKTTETFTYNTRIYKYEMVDFMGNPGKNALSGAEFELYYDEAGTQLVNLVKVGDSYRVATAAEIATDGFTSAVIEAGTTHIFGLDGNTDYYLKEIKAPEGYNLLKELVKVEIDETNANAEIENKKGVELPSTGGIGTTIFYLVGGLMVTGAFVLLMTKKRMGNRA